MNNLNWWVVEFYGSRGLLASFRVLCAESRAVLYARRMAAQSIQAQTIGTRVVLEEDVMGVTDLRKLAIHVQCRSKRTAADDFKARLNALISRAPKIRFWS